MTHPATPEVGGEATPVDARTDALNAFEDLAGEFFAEEEDQPAEGELEGEQPEGETEEAADETEIEAEETDELPPIDAPVSWTAEEKDRFAGLPRETQEFIAKRETERERFVQSKAQEAARVKQETEAAAIEQLSHIQRTYAQQYEAIAAQFDVPEPDLSLLATDQMAYFSQLQAHKHAQAQRMTAQQRASEYAQQAAQYEQQVEQQRLSQEYAVIVEQFPEYADPTTGPQIQQELSAVARELGYPAELIAEARATDILAMKKVADYKAKADKYDALQKGKMEKVRAAKGLPKVATPGVAVSADATRQSRSNQAWEATKTSKGQSRDQAFATYLQAQGIL